MFYTAIMKKLTHLFLAIVTIVAVSCGKTPTNSLDGGPHFGNIYIWADGALINAHEAVITLPSSEGFTNLEIISYGLREIEKLGGNPDIVLEERFSYPPADSELFKENSSTIDQYKQIVRVVYKPNLSTKTKKATFRLYAEGYNGFASDITFVQEGQRIYPLQ